MKEIRDNPRRQKKGAYFKILNSVCVPIFFGGCSLILKQTHYKKLLCMNGAECRPQAPVAEGGPVGFFDGGNRRDWFPGAGGVRTASSRLKSDIKPFNAFVLGLPKDSAKS